MSLFLLVILALMLFLNLYSVIFGELYRILSLILKQTEMAMYITLTSALVLFEPILLCVLKVLRTENYREKIGKNEKDELEIEIKDVQIDLSDKIYVFVDALPLRGIIHFVNLIFVVSANVIKINEIEFALSSNIIYMGVITYYAFDKLISYLAKKYEAFWAKLDNKIFYTQEIKKYNKVDAFGIFKISFHLLKTYIETGEYGTVNNIKEEG